MCPNSPNDGLCPAAVQARLILYVQRSPAGPAPLSQRLHDLDRKIAWGASQRLVGEKVKAGNGFLLYKDIVEIFPEQIRAN